MSLEIEVDSNCREIVRGSLMSTAQRGLVRLASLNVFILKQVRHLEMIGVLMRIFSFSLVSWLGPQSPFMFVWIVNTTDALLLSWCAIVRKDKSYTVLNVFWVMVGVVGILRAGNILH